MSDRTKTLVVERPEQLWRPETRREFLRLLGIGGTVVMLPSMFAACDDDDNGNGNGNGGAVALNLSNDLGILNYAYALEQLEAGFYTAVVAAPAFAGMTAEEREVLTDLRNHEVIHREFLEAALGTNAIPPLALNNATVTNAVRDAASILQTAEGFEDLGVAAYNGAGKYLTTPANLAAAGSIVAVEARHAAAIRDIRDLRNATKTYRRFAGDDVVVPASGLDVKLEPSVVLTRVGATQFVSTSISIGTQPATKPGTNDFGPPNPTP